MERRGNNSLFDRLRSELAILPLGEIGFHATSQHRAAQILDSGFVSDKGKTNGLKYFFYFNPQPSLVGLNSVRSISMSTEELRDYAYFAVWDDKERENINPTNNPPAILLFSIPEGLRESIDKGLLEESLISPVAVGTTHPIPRELIRGIVLIPEVLQTKKLLTTEERRRILEKLKEEITHSEEPPQLQTG